MSPKTFLFRVELEFESGNSRTEYLVMHAADDMGKRPTFAQADSAYRALSGACYDESIRLIEFVYEDVRNGTDEMGLAYLAHHGAQT